MKKSTVPVIRMTPVKYTLHKWCLAPSADGQIILSGCVDTKGKAWKNVAVANRIDRWSIEAPSGTIYTLDGPLDQETSLQLGVSSNVIQFFSRGFPSRWRSIIPKTDDCERIGNKHTMTTRSKTLFWKHTTLNSSRPVSEDSLLLTHKPKKEELVEETNSCPKFQLRIVAERLILDSETVSSGTISVKDLNRKRKCSEPKSKQVFKSRRKRRNSVMSEETSTLEQKIKRPKVEKPKRLRDRKLRSTKDEIHFDFPSKHDTQIRKSQRRTNKKKVEEDIAIISPPKPSTSTLLKKSVCSTNRTTETGLFQTPRAPSTSQTKRTAKENAGPKESPQLVLNARKGTFKRRLQTKKLLEKVNQGHEDNFLDSTPFKNRKNRFSDLTKENTPLGLICKTPHMWTSPFQPSTANKKPVQEESDSEAVGRPGQNDDRYLHQRSVWAKERAKRSKGKVKPSPLKKVKTKQKDLEEFYAILKSKTVEEQSDQEEDFYFVLE